MEYICKNCKEEWHIEAIVELPVACPLCSMSIRDAFLDIWKEEGLLEAIRFIVKNRLF